MNSGIDELALVDSGAEDGGEAETVVYCVPRYVLMELQE